MLINTVKKDRKIYKSQLRIGTKRPGEMKAIVEGVFLDSFLYFEVDEKNHEYIIGVTHELNIKAYERFTKDFPCCKVNIYKPIEFSVLKSIGNSPS